MSIDFIKYKKSKNVFLELLEENKKIFSQLYFSENKTVFGIKESVYKHENGLLYIYNIISNQVLYLFDSFVDKAFHGINLRNKRKVILRPYSLPDISKFSIIVARYNENIEWMEMINKNAILYNKGKDITGDFQIIKIDNIGREANTYLRYIIDNYNSLPNKMLFLQGNPFDHRLKNFMDYYTSKNKFESILNIKVYERNVDEILLHLKLDKDIFYWFLKKYTLEDKINRIEYSQGAQFCVSRDIILRNGLEYYKDLYDMTCESMYYINDLGKSYSDYSIGCLLEIFWPYIFKEYIK